jgi:6-pyruvoyl-tetrahydropterin synthase
MAKIAKKRNENTTPENFGDVSTLADVIALSDLNLDENWAMNFMLWTVALNTTNPYYARKLTAYRGIDLGIVDKDELKKYFDPSPHVRREEKADIMRTNFEPCPLIHSLNLIIQKNIESIPIELRVIGSDKLSQDKKAVQKLRMLTRRDFVDMVNTIKKITNDVPIPYDANIDKVGNNDDTIDDELNIIDEIKKEATTNWDFNALNEAGALKDGVEISHEQMMSYYFNESKFKENIAGRLVSDFMKANICMYRFYTNAINGLPEVQYIDPSTVITSTFQKKDGEDMDYWYCTFQVSWQEYMQMIGGKQTPEKNREIYEANRMWMFPNEGYPSYPLNSSGLDYTLMNVQIRLGYFEVKKHVYNANTEKYYDTIKKFYYLPFGVNLNQTPYKAEWILDLGDLQDMYRYGTNLQRADFSLVVYRDNDRQSFYDVQQGDYLRLNLIYNQWLNTFANFIPEGVAFASETIEELAEILMAEEEDLMREKGQDITSLSMQKIREKIIRNYVLSGRGLFKMRKGDNDEQRLDKPTFIMENKILQNCTQLMQQMFMVFNQMKMSLGLNDSRLAQDPKPRQTLTGIEMATQSSFYSTKNLEDAFTYALMGFGQRMLYYDQQVITEFNDKGEPITERAKEMKALIGMKGTTWLEVYKDMPYQRCILKVFNLPSAQERINLMAITNQYELEGSVEKGTLLIANEIVNFKLAKLYVIMALRRQKRINMENQMEMMNAQGQAQQQAFQMQQQAELAKQDQLAQNEARILTLENALKTQGQIDVKDKTNQNRLQENQQSAELDMTKKVQEKELENL